MDGTAFPVHDPVRYLTGRWRLDRRIVDERSGQTGTFVGAAEFRPAGDGLWYRESGELEFGGHRGEAWRELSYRRGDGTVLRVEFDDGRYFHDLDLSVGRWAVTHPCRADEYEGEFGIEGPDRWWQDWRVTGPAKDQRFRTDFHRLSGDVVGAVDPN
ncbi:MAG: DUF6314 family protein [Actinocatenispora sp.]